MHHPTDRIAHTTAFVTPVVVHWLERESCINYYVRLTGVKPFFGDVSFSVVLCVHDVRRHMFLHGRYDFALFYNCFLSGQMAISEK